MTTDTVYEVGDIVWFMDYSQWSCVDEIVTNISIKQPSNIKLHSNKVYELHSIPTDPKLNSLVGCNTPSLFELKCTSFRKRD